MRTAPPVASYSRVTSLSIVLLPLPLAPTTATDSPGRMRALTPLSTCACVKVSDVTVMTEGVPCESATQDGSAWGL